MKRIALVVALLFVAGSAGAQTARPKIGLALSGGGAKGCAHVGVLRELQKMHVPVDYVAGTSMGAVVGALYASGMSPDEIEKELTTIDWDEALSDATAFPGLMYRRKWEETRYPSTVEAGFRNGKLMIPSGIRTGQKLSFLLSRFLLPVLDQNDFSKLPIPYAAVATDLETGDPYVMTHGDIAEAVRASMSIPSAFTPVEMDGHILVDGGVTMNVPVTVAREMGADIVIAVDIASGLSKRDELNSAREVVGQLSSFLTRKNMEKQLAAADLVLSPDITGFTVFGFDKAKQIVAVGEKEAIAKRAEIAKYSVDPELYAKLAAARPVPPPRDREIKIDSIRVVGLHFVEERFVRDQMTTQVGETLDMDKLQKDIEWMYGYGDFIGIHAGLETNEGQHTLIVRVQEKPWGPAYVRTGIGVETRYNKPGVFLLLNYTKRWVNPRGAEWRNDIEFGTDWGIWTEFYQPRGYDKVGFLSATAGYDRKSLRAFANDEAIGDYDVRQFQLFADGGVQLANAGELRIGLFQRWNDASVEVGLPGYPTLHNSEAGFRAVLNINTLNEPFFPISGARIQFNALAPLKAWGADEDYIMTDLRSAAVASYGRHVFSAGLTLHQNFNADGPVYDQAILGGLANLGGYPYGSVIGQAGAVASVGYRNRVTRIPGLSQGVYAGFIAEAGDAYHSLSQLDAGDLKTSGTVYLGLNTSYGPLMLAVGKAPHHDVQYYIQIGRSF